MSARIEAMCLIRRLRDEGTSQVKMGAWLGLSPSTVSMLLKGSTSLSERRAAVILGLYAAHEKGMPGKRLPVLMLAGEGPRPNCVHEGACVSRFADAFPAARACHCPRDCKAFRRDEPSVEHFTRTGLSALSRIPC